MKLSPKRRLAAAVTLVLCISVFLGNRYIRDRKMNSSVDFIMDTVVEQKLYGRESDAATKEIARKLREYENTYSMYQLESEISQINQNAGKAFTKVSPQVLDLIKRAVEISEQVDGSFDITIAPLTKLWGITSDHPKVPAAEEVDAARQLVGYQNLEIQGDQVRLKEQGESIDLGAIAKGAACDIVRQVAGEFDLLTGYVSIGGNMVVLGDGIDGNPYLFGIRDPQGDASQYVGTVSLTGKTMATTGGYERFFEEDGKRYHHVIDPKTGYPAETDLLSVSVISEDGSLADALSTALFIQGKDKVLTLLDRDDFQIVAVDLEGKIIISKGLVGVFKPS